MASNEDQDPQAFGSSHTLRSGLGTQHSNSYSAEEMATPSGEVIFNFRPTGSAEAPLSRGEQQFDSGSIFDSHELGEVVDGERLRPLQRAGLREVEDRRPQGSLHRARGRFDHDSYTSQRLGEVEGSRRLAEIPTASMGRAGFDNYNRGDFGQGESPLWARRNLNREGQYNNNRVSYSGVKSEDIPSYRTTRTNREMDSTLPLRPSAKKPANYDGTTSIQDYLVQFEMTSELNRWDNSVKAMELATSLRGAAQSILSDLRPEQRRDYDHLVSVLTARFEPINQTELYRAQIKGRLRKKSESVQELAQDIKRLVRRAYPQASSYLRDQIARDCFMDALNEHELEWFVYQGKPKTVDEATQLALEYEAFQSGRKRSQMVRQCTKEDSPEAVSLAKLNEQLENLQIEISKLKNKPDDDITCFSCKQRGHKRKDCPKSSNQQNLPYNRYHNNAYSYQGRGYNRQSNTTRNNQGNAQ